MTLREQLQELMDEKGVNAPKLSHLTELSYDTVNNFLREKSQITAENYDKCITALNQLDNK